MEYYLIDEEDLGITIVRKSSLVLDEYDIIDLEKGSTVKFLYPEGSTRAREYEGTIVAVSGSEEEIVEIRKEEIRKFRSGKVNKNDFAKNFFEILMF